MTISSGKYHATSLKDVVRNICCDNKQIDDPKAKPNPRSVGVERALVFVMAYHIYAPVKTWVETTKLILTNSNSCKEAIDRKKTEVKK